MQPPGAIASGDRRVIQALLWALKPLSNLRRWPIPLSYAVAFLTVALEEGKPVGRYARELQLNRYVMTGCMQSIGERRRNGKAGLGLVALSVRGRVSSRMASNPARFRPACSHCNNGPASTPICFTVMPGTPKELPRASGSLATFVFFTILCIHDAHARLFQ